jgi:acetyl-CoA C-acetyltransferase
MASRTVLLTDRVSDPRTPVIVDALRTPVGTAGGVLGRVEVTDLAAPVLRSLHRSLVEMATRDRGHRRDGTDETGGRDSTIEVDDVVLGNCMGPGGDPARVASLAAGLGLEVPALTVDRQCGSGLDTIGLGALRVLAGGVVLAGGAESASTAPTRLALTEDGSRRPYQRARFAPDEYGDPGMGEAAEQLARHAGITRERQDEYAARSHARVLEARQRGWFDAELVPVPVPDQADPATRDERPRPGLSPQTLARFRPAFVASGTVTAGNSCGISDGAAAVAVVPEALRRALGVPGLAVRAYALCGTDPRLPGLGSVPAVRAVLAAAGLSWSDIGQFEITEAFASQVLACTDALGLDALGADADLVCPDGGAIALGHPWGASGALLVVRLFSRMVRRPGSRFGIATCPVGGGQGVALLVERVGPERAG